MKKKIRLIALLLAALMLLAACGSAAEKPAEEKEESGRREAAPAEEEPAAPAEEEPAAPAEEEPAAPAEEAPAAPAEEEPAQPEPTPAPTPEPTPEPLPVVTPEPTPEPTPVPTPEPTPVASAVRVIMKRQDTASYESVLLLGLQLGNLPQPRVYLAAGKLGNVICHSVSILIVFRYLHDDPLVFGCQKAGVLRPEHTALAGGVVSVCIQMRVFLRPLLVDALGNDDSRTGIVDGDVLEIAFFLDVHSANIL